LAQGFQDGWLLGGRIGLKGELSLQVMGSPKIADNPAHYPQRVAELPVLPAPGNVFPQQIFLQRLHFQRVVYNAVPLTILVSGAAQYCFALKFGVSVFGLPIVFSKMTFVFLKKPAQWGACTN
jgi:hypothetical protein